MSDLYEFLDYGAIVLLDTETTGLDVQKCRIIELAALRLEWNDQGMKMGITERYDNFIKLPEGQTIPEKITDITGITNNMLIDGISEEQAVFDFLHIIREKREPNNYWQRNKGKSKPTLLVAHNAQFDLLFIKETLARYGVDDLLLNADVLDTLTVYKDRSPYPHKLSDAISEYGLDDKVQNTHRAIDDALALYEVFKALDEERTDLFTYINVFGYNPKYGISGEKLPGIIYCAQPYTDDLQSPECTLPAKAFEQKIAPTTAAEQEQDNAKDMTQEQETRASVPKRRR